MFGERRCSGKAFHVLGAATRKLRLPNSVLIDGTHRSPRCTERSLALPPTSVSGVQMLQKYEGQVPRTQSKASTATLQSASIRCTPSLLHTHARIPYLLLWLSAHCANDKVPINLKQRLIWPWLQHVTLCFGTERSKTKVTQTGSVNIAFDQQWLSSPYNEGCQILTRVGLCWETRMSVDLDLQCDLEDARFSANFQPVSRSLLKVVEDSCIHPARRM